MSKRLLDLSAPRVAPVSVDTPREVLVVDDDDACRQMTCAQLEEAGFEVHEAVDGVDAYDAILEMQHALIVTDWAMPRMDGIELIRNLRTSALSWYPYVLLLTAKDDQVAGMESGADDFLSKPVDSRLLLQRLQVGHRIIRLHETLRENNARLNDANEQLTELAIKDVLSGLLNRRAFFEHAEREWNRSVRYDLPISCLLMDIDHFKRVNDTYGHPAGDCVIRKVGEVIRKLFREIDVLGRYGGEEFSVVLFDCDVDAAATIAERLRQTIERLRMPEIDKDFQFTISLGLASRSLEVVNLDALVDHADQALLNAKRTGRNRVARFDEISPASKLLDEKPPEIEERDRANDAAIPYQVVNTLLAALKFRDNQAVEHSRRVSQLCREFAQHLGLSPAERVSLEVAALLHDVGRLAIPDELLQKAGELSEIDFVMARQHHQVTVEILKSCFSDRRLITTVSLSGKWFDGSQGDPAGEDIPKDARILAICSLYDDIVHGRGWWHPHKPLNALKVLRQSSGSRLDPGLLDEFATLIKHEGHPELVSGETR